MLHFLGPALRKANLYQTYAKLTPHSYAVRMKHMNATLAYHNVQIQRLGYEKNCKRNLRLP